MDEELVRIREAAKKKLHNSIIDAYTKFDTKKALRSIEERIIGEMNDVADKLMGIDRRWHEIEIKEGRIRTLIGNEVDRVLTERVKPMIDAHIARVIEYKAVQEAIKKAVRTRVDSAIYSLAHHNSTDTGKLIDQLVQSHIDTALKEYLDVNAPQ